MSSGPSVRLVLPHQLFDQHFEAAGGTLFVLIEHDLLFRQYRFHSHKLVLHRASLARFAARLREHGYEVVVLPSDTERSSHDQLAECIRKREPAQVTWFDVVDDWLEQDLFAGLADGGYRMRPGDVLETPNFLTDRVQIDDWFSHNGSRMQDFYVWQRRRLDILLENGKPVGGKWSFDVDNRKKLPRGYTPHPVGRFAGHPVLRREGVFDFDALVDDPDTVEVPAEVDAAIAWVSAEFPNAPGDPHLFAWPTSADEAREHLQEFVRDRLNDFGPYEDAISATHPFINHGLLTGALNVGLLDPRDVVDAVLEGADHGTPLASLEGFVRQMIGWREYMRATYRTRGREMRTSNRLDHQRALGDGWWDATTGLAPVDLVISRVLDTGYAHHIERLMVLGNAMSLLRIHPDAVYEWFMEMFIDAYDWVMVPNVYAMSHFAAGDEITTKPYVSGSNYLRKMSDLPAGEWMADWDGLYWTFIDDHREVFAANPRTRMVVSLLGNMDPGTWDGHRRRAQALLGLGHNTALLKAIVGGTSR
ncbi:MULTISPECIES: cryptochrome/photolyase family protein [unclassified Cryobacterium]|uniref:cryptochrome/photolyase family protein n=1 Tax=unclassified Cryobacterium TaxID=2649013 RepID=UPI00106D3FC4|nr:MULTISPECIES: cryptochrome/photolyase family protein [unclassified Cryobacterium]TFC56092.1 cryptochrome/photolyase family protein [Cryobacterium sp. TMB3-1-2]TFC69674.1 cryptochrome/photolyase family protein [Cryobacterium sp. TMB3-15]TFC78040.1 cryptochrome/photolyase family protein [Cryobacterium sp. TMB3-10]TFD39564.1 cryptochrome/photolyase family protein [Cryobacterium sp. TMB3-12]